MPSIPEPVRQQVFVEADHRCEYCRTSRRVIGIPLVIDHLIPQSLGGTDERENLAAACYRCNEFKGAKTYASDSTTSTSSNLASYGSPVIGIRQESKSSTWDCTFLPLVTPRVLDEPEHAAPGPPTPD